MELHNDLSVYNVWASKSNIVLYNAHHRHYKSITIPKILLTRFSTSQLEPFECI